MGYRVELLRNGNPATIVISVKDDGWCEAYQRWKKGKNPTDSPEWKYGIIAETSKIFWYVCCNGKLVSVYHERGSAETILPNFTATYPGKNFSILGLTQHEYHEREKYKNIRWDASISKIPHGEKWSPSYIKNHVIYSAKMCVHNGFSQIEVVYQSNIGR